MSTIQSLIDAGFMAVFGGDQAYPLESYEVVVDSEVVRYCDISDIVRVYCGDDDICDVVCELEDLDSEIPYPVSVFKVTKELVL